MAMVQIKEEQMHAAQGRPDRQGNFAQGKIPRIILSIAVPTTVAQLTQLLYSLADRVYLGHLHDLSTAALTAIGLCLPLIAIILAFCNLFSAGGMPLCSMARGRGNDEEAALLQGNTCALLLWSGLAIMLLSYAAMRPLLYLFGASDQSYPYAREYLEIYLLGTVFAQLGTGMMPFISVQGRASRAMLYVISGAVLNIILDPIFIFYLDLGIRGAALASVIAQLVVCLLVLHFLLSKSAVLPFARRHLKLNWERSRRIMGLGSAGFVMSSTNGVVQIACNLTLRSFGGDALIGIMTVLMSVRDLIFEPTKCLTHSAQPVIAYNYGAGIRPRIYEAVRFMTWVTVLYLGAAWLLIFLFPEYILRLFNADGHILEAGVHALHIYFFGFFFMAFHSCGQSTFVGLGMSKKAIFFALFRKILIVVPLTLLLPHCFGLGSDGVFLAEPISNVLSGIVCFGVMWLTLKHLTVKSR